MIDLPPLLIDPPAIVQIARRDRDHDRRRDRRDADRLAIGAAVIGSIVILSDGTACQIRHTAHGARVCLPTDR